MVTQLYQSVSPSLALKLVLDIFNRFTFPQSSNLPLSWEKLNKKVKIERKVVIQLYISDNFDKEAGGHFLIDITSHSPRKLNKKEQQFNWILFFPKSRRNMVRSLKPQIFLYERKQKKSKAGLDASNATAKGDDRSWWVEKRNLFSKAIKEALMKITFEQNAIMVEKGLVKYNLLNKKTL